MPMEKIFCILWQNRILSQEQLAIVNQITYNGITHESSAGEIAEIAII